MQWQSQLFIRNFRGVMRARCYPFDMPKSRFHGFNPKVCNYSLNVDVYVLIYEYILVYTRIYIVELRRTQSL